MLEFILILFSLLLTIWVFVLSKSDKAVFNIMMWAYLLRFALLIVDYNQIFILPGSGADTENFHFYAITNQHSANKDYLTNYTVFLTYLYAITDCSRLFAQYLNLIMGMILLIYLNKSLALVKIEKKIRLNCIRILAFLPNVVIFSVILLREVWVEMFIVISAYHFIKWYVGRSGNLGLLISFICVFAATWMHVGSIAILFGYIICLLIFDRKTMQIHFSRYSIVAMGIMVAFVFLFLLFADSFFGKLVVFTELSFDESVESVMDSEREEAGSTYLNWLSYSNPVHLIIFIPLKMFYFLYSPLPFDWRGIMDVVAFLMDSSIYIYLSYKILTSPVDFKKYKYLNFFLLVCFIFATFMLSMGTIASGTAIRHRAKIISLLLVCYGISMTYKTRSLDLRRKDNHESSYNWER